MRYSSKFLRIYSKIFSVYLLITFLGTQNNMYEIVIAGAATVIAIFVQVFYFRNLIDREPSSKDSFVTLRLDEIDHVDS